MNPEWKGLYQDIIQWMDPAVFAAGIRQVEFFIKSSLYDTDLLTQRNRREKSIEWATGGLGYFGGKICEPFFMQDAKVISADCAD